MVITMIFQLINNINAIPTVNLVQTVVLVHVLVAIAIEEIVL